jgi:rare lipoprotein A
MVGALVALSVVGCASMRRDHGGAAQTGQASYYGHAFHGRKTASGERFDMWDMTAAHRDLAMGTRVRVTNLANGRAVVVRINDRGPYHGKRIIDVSYAAARKLGMIETGVARVRVEVVPR